MSIDLGDTPVGTPPTNAQKLQLARAVSASPYDAGNVTGDIALDVDHGIFQKLTLTGATVARVLNPPTNGAEGEFLTVRITSAAGVDRTLTCHEAIVWAADWVPVLPKALTAAKTYLVKLYYNGTAWELVSLDMDTVNPLVKSANFTAEIDKRYHITDTCTVTDPPGVEGRGFEVLVLSGTVTVGGMPFTGAGKFIRRVFYSGEWTILDVLDVDGLSSILAGYAFVSQSDLAAGIYDFLTGATTLPETVPQRFGENYRPILRRVRTAMSMAQESLSILVIGDSMGDAQGSSTTTGEWVSQCAYRIAALFPLYNVVHKVYDQPNARYTSYAVQTGTNGERYLSMPSGNLYEASIPVDDMITPTTYDCDVRVKFLVTTWSGFTTAVLAAEYVGTNTSDTRFRLMVTNSKTLIMTWLSTTTGFNQATSSAFTNADNTPIWVRATMQANVSGNNVVKFYTSTNGTTWTQLGSTATNAWNTGNQPLNAINLSMTVGGRGVGNEPFKGGKIFEVQSYDGVDGPPRCPCNIDSAQWIGYGTPGTTAPTLAGSPTLVINNASVYGYSISGLLALSNKPWLRNDGRGFTVLAQGYNNAENPTAFKAQLDAALTAVRTRRPLDNLLAIVEPFSSANTATLHYLSDMRKRGVIMDWAPRNNCGLLDMHGVFENAGGSLFSDNIHPNATGSQLWATTFMAAFAE